RIGDGLWPQFLLVPQIAVELEEARRAIGAVGIADQKLDVEVANDFDLFFVQPLVLLLEPRAAFFQSLDRKVRRIAVIGGRVRQAVEVRSVKPKLNDLG